MTHYAPKSFSSSQSRRSARARSDALAEIRKWHKDAAGKLESCPMSEESREWFRGLVAGLAKALRDLG